MLLRPSAGLRAALSRAADEPGQDLMEYAILSATIVFAVAVAFSTVFGPETFLPFAEKIQACIGLDGDNCRLP